MRVRFASETSRARFILVFLARAGDPRREHSFNDRKKMKKLTRRDFVKSGLAGISAVSAGLLFSGFPAGIKIDQVELGETGLKVSRLALGTGTGGYARQSAFTRMDQAEAMRIAHRAYESGVTLMDTADSYGTHPFVRRFLKEVPRENCQIMTKIWTEDTSWNTVTPVSQTLDRFRQELNTDQIEIVLLHCLMSGDWPQTKTAFRDGLDEAKSKNIVKKVGVSCHDYKALEVAVDDPWVDVILARINPGQVAMDGTPEQIMSLLKRAKENGKGVIGMKIFGAGQWNNENQKQESLNFVIKSGNVHAMTIGMTSMAYVADSVERITSVVHGLQA